jgi:hypothetical protein
LSCSVFVLLCFPSVFFLIPSLYAISLLFCFFFPFPFLSSFYYLIINSFTFTTL